MAEAGQERIYPARTRAGQGNAEADILRATKKVQGFHDALSVHLLEASPVLQQKQWKTLAGKHPSISWHQKTDTLPDMPVLLVANEFFDAMPVHQYIGGAERMVVLNDEGELHFTAEGDIKEQSPVSQKIMRELAGMIARHGGAGIVIDYGYVGGSKGDSLQAMKKHEYHPVLQTPGEADITAHVDFDALAQAAKQGGAEVYGATPQGKFLLQIGASQRLMNLCAQATDTQKTDLMSGFERLIAHEQMGELFKVLAVLPPGSARPEGF